MHAVPATQPPSHPTRRPWLRIVVPPFAPLKVIAGGMTVQVHAGNRPSVKVSVSHLGGAMPSNTLQPNMAARGTDADKKNIQKMVKELGETVGSGTRLVASP